MFKGFKPFEKRYLSRWLHSWVISFMFRVCFWAYCDVSWKCVRHRKSLYCDKAAGRRSASCAFPVSVCFQESVSELTFCRMDCFVLATVRNQLVTLDQTGEKVRIVGITLDHGLLRTKRVVVNSSGDWVDDGQVIDLQPNSNSFDMLSGLIKQKTWLPWFKIQVALAWHNSNTEKTVGKDTAVRAGLIDCCGNVAACLRCMHTVMKMAE